MNDQRGPLAQRPLKQFAVAKVDQDHSLTGQLRDVLKDLKYGNVEITLQDGVVIQIQRIERIAPHRKGKQP